MYKKAKLFLVSMMLVCAAVVSSHAQVTGRDPGTEAARLQAAITKAVDTAVFENGRVRSIRITLPNDRERLLTFEHAEDQRSFTISDAGRKIRVVLDDLRRISEVIFPDGKKAKFEWVKAPTGYWVPATIKIDGKELRPDYNVVGDCSEVCERAAALTVLAMGTCIAAGPLSAACWAATGAATLATYYCYRCTHPQVEDPPEN